MPLTPTQCRMARAGLKWSVDDLAVLARVSRATVMRFENEQVTSIPATQEALQRAFENGGIEFRGEDGLRLPVKRGEAPAPQPVARSAAPASGLYQDMRDVSQDLRE